MIAKLAGSPLFPGISRLLEMFSPIELCFLSQ